jgi:hypothetical protein
MKEKNNNQSSAYDYHDTFDEDGIAVAGKNGKFGYVGRNGKEITPLKYDKAMRFYWNIGRVCLNCKWGLVDRSGKEITPLIYDEIKGHQDPVVKLNGKYGYVNRKTGELLTPVKYDKACAWVQIFDFSDDDFVRNDLAAVQLDGKWGCIDVNGKEIVPLKYDEIEIHQSEDPCVSARLKRKWGFIDVAGKEQTPFEYSSVEPFREGRARVKKKSKYGFIDSKGVIVIPIIYDYCESHFIKGDKHIPPIAVALDGKYGYIDIDGNEIVKPLYEYAASFYRGNGTAAVALNGKVGFIYKTGKVIIPFIYDMLDNTDGYVTQKFGFFDNFANVKLNGKWGVIDKNNHLVIPFVYDEFLENRGAGWRYALRDGKKLSIDTKGHERLMQKNPAARTFKEYLRAVTREEVIESHCIPRTQRNKKILGVNFDNFSTKASRPSQNIIRIHADYYRKGQIDVKLYCVKDECWYGYFDWDEVLDMEVRIEDDLVLSDAEIVACCIWGACDKYLTTEETIRILLDRLHEQVKTEDENRQSNNTKK